MGFLSLSFSLSYSYSEVLYFSLWWWISQKVVWILRTHWTLPLVSGYINRWPTCLSQAPSPDVTNFNESVLPIKQHLQYLEELGGIFHCTLWQNVYFLHVWQTHCRCSEFLFLIIVSDNAFFKKLKEYFWYLRAR